MNNIVFFDIDGTLTPFGKDNISKRTAEALKYLKQENEKIVFLTGRSIKRTLKLPFVEYADYVACSGGSIILENKTRTILKQESFSKEAFNEMMEQIKNDNKVSYSYLTLDNDNTVNESNQKYLKLQLQNEKREYPKIVSYDEMLNDLEHKKILSFTIFTEPDHKIKFLNQTTRYILPFNSLHYGIDYFTPNANKGSVVKFFKEKFPKSKTIAFGDSENDIPALKEADYGVCVGYNETVMENTDITALPVEKDGVAFFIEKMYDTIIKKEVKE